MLSGKVLIMFSVALLFSDATFSQTVTPEGIMYGEQMRKVFQGMYKSVVATQKKIYEESGNKWGLKYGVPKGYTIKDVKFKKIPPGQFSSHHMILLLQGPGGEGAFYDYDANNFIQIAPAASVSWDKLGGDALYARSTSGFFVSYNDGNTWLSDTAGLGAGVLDFDVDTLQYVFVTTNNGLFKQDSSAAMNPWSLVSSFPTTSGLTKVYCDRTTRILVQVNNTALYISNNYGGSWQLDTAGLGTQNMNFACDDSLGNLYVVTGNNKVYMSALGTAPWVLISNPINALSGPGLVINSISGNDMIYLATNFGVFESSDYGVSWSVNNKRIFAENVSSVVKLPSGRKLASSALGVFSFDSNDSLWVQRYPSIGFKSGLKLYAGIGNNVYLRDQSILVGNAESVFKSTDGGNTWSVDTAGLYQVSGNSFFLDEAENMHYANSYFGSGYFNTLWERPASGSWTTDTVGMHTGNFSATFSLGTDYAGYVYASGNLNGNKVYRRPVTGGTWVTDTLGLGTLFSLNSFTGAPSQGIYGISGTFIMHRGSTSWQNIPLPASAPPSSTVLSFCVDTTGRLFADIGNGLNRQLYYTSNMGSSWTPLGLDSIFISSMYSYKDTTYFYSSGYWIYQYPAGAQPPPVSAFTAAADSICEGDTIHFTDNSTGLTTGWNWTFNGGTPPTSTAQNPDVIYSTAGIFDVQLIASNAWGNNTLLQPAFINVSVCTGIDERQSEEYFTCYPNPFSDQILFTYKMNSTEPVLLELTDISGRVIISRKIENSSPPSNTIPLSTKEIQAGFYFARFRSGKQQFTSKLVSIQ